MEAYGGASVSVREDNEELDNLVLARAVVSHPTFVAAGTDPDTSAKHSCTQYLTNGGQGVLKKGGLNVTGGGINKASTNEKSSFKVGIKRSLNSIRESGRGVKRSQPKLENGSVKAENSSEMGLSLNRNKKENTVHAVQFEANCVNAEKPGAALLGWRFNDVPATVPIKKRRIHMADVLRSPSPPPSSLSPGIGSPPLSFLSPSPPPLSASPRSPSSLARLSPISSLPSILPSPRSSCLESRSPLSTSPAPPMSSSPRSPSPELRSPPSGSQASPRISPYPSAISCHLPNLVSLGCELNAEAGNVTVTSSGVSHAEQLMEGNKQDLAVKSSLLPSKPLSPKLFHDDNIIKEEEDKEEQDEVCFTSAKRYPDVEDFDVAVESEESAREVRIHGTLDVMGQQSCPEGIQGVSGRLKSDFSCDDRSHWDLNMEMEAWERLTDQTAVNELEEKTSREFPCTSISVDSNESRHNENVDVSVEAVVKVQAVEEHETEKCVDLGTSECREEDNGSVGIGELMVLHNESDWKAEVAAENVEFDNPGSWEGETASDGEADEMSWMEEVPQNVAPAGSNPDLKLEKDATSSRTKATGWDQVSEENVDYGDSDWRDVEDVGLDVDEKASVVLQADINWSSVGETGNLKDNSDCQEVDTVSNEAQEKSGLCEERLKASCCDSQLSESSLEKDGNSGRSKFTGWDRLPEGFENVEEAWKVMQESSARSGCSGPWGSLQRRGSFLNSRGTPRGSGLGSVQAVSRDGFTSVSGERFFGNLAQSDDFLDTRKFFGRGRWLDDSHNGSSKFTSSCDRRPGGKFVRRREIGFHGTGRASRWIEPGVAFGKRGSGRGHANAAAVAAAKVESSGFIVAPDGTITKAGGGIASRGGVRSRIAGRRGAHRRFTNVGRGPVDVEAAVSFPSRVHVGTGKGMVGTSLKVGRDMGGRGFGQNVGQGHVRSMAESGKLVGLGIVDKNQGPHFGGGGMEHRRNELPHRLLRVLDHSGRNSHTSPNFRPDLKVGRPNMGPSHCALGHSKFVATGVSPSQGSSSLSSKLSGEKRGGELLQGKEFKQALPHPCMPTRRTSPHVSYGPSSIDERGRQVLSEVQHSPSLRAGLNSAASAGMFGNCRPEIRQLRQNGDDGIGVTGSQPREGGEYSRTSPIYYNKDRENNDSLSKRDRFKDNDRRRDLNKLSVKDGRSIRGHKLASAWEEDDDVAPRRRRP